MSRLSALREGDAGSFSQIVHEESHRDACHFHNIGMSESLFSLNRPAVDKDSFAALGRVHHIEIPSSTDHRCGFRGKPAGEGNHRIVLRPDQRDMLGEPILGLTRFTR
jgi:hypothetical protein